MIVVRIKCVWGGVCWETADAHVNVHASLGQSLVHSKGNK